ncbi:MAG: substrate-binding domain-containing protein, partial [Candidatus Bathyarchaeia archaeon]
SRILETFRGGSSGGGGASLTSLGVQLLSEYERLQAAINEVLKRPQWSVSKGTRFLGPLEHYDLLIAGSHCVGIDIIIDELKHRNPRLKCGILNTGSTAGLVAVALGEADVAGMHILHTETGEYNVPFIKALGLSGKISLIRGYRRQQGLLVKRGNPKKVTSFKQLLQRDVKIVNRKLGTGTRRLFDALLQREFPKFNWSQAVASEKIRGYSFEVNSHTEAAEAVATGKAHVALGIRAAAEMFKLDFIRLAEESFDFAVSSDRLMKTSIRNLAVVLRSEQFKSTLAKDAPGCRATEESGAVVYPPHFDW